MKKWALFLGFMSAVLLAHSENSSTIDTAECLCEETVFSVSTKDLVFDKDEILVLIGKDIYPVWALQRSGDQWRVQVTSNGYCQSGHNLCSGCGLCHKPGCIYYIRPCRLWN
jgi:hypothetical protein